MSTYLRRAARSYPNASSLPSRPTTPTIPPLVTKGHQRRHSSSKPPVPPNNGSPSIPATSVKQVGAPRTEKKVGTESRFSKRKLPRDKVDSKVELHNEWTLNLPSVPSTQYLVPKDVYVASFFSTYRPISITGPLPPDTQIEDIEKIFQPKPNKSRTRTGTTDVIYTITSAVENLDEQIASKLSTQQDNGVAQRADLIKALTQHNDGVTSAGDSNNVHHIDGPPQPTSGINIPTGNVKMVIQELTRRFRPFNPPPAPVPVPDLEFRETTAERTTTQAREEEEQARALEIQIEDQETSPQVTQVVMDIREHSNMEQGRFFTSHRTPLIPQTEDGLQSTQITEPTTTTTEVTPRRRGVCITERTRRHHDGMLLISVKRQRRLKMKKHKYKKLMRKTRNLRRRQDRL